MKKIKDPIILGIAAGLTGNLVKNISNLLGIKAGTARKSYAGVASGMYMTLDPKTVLAGYLNHTLYGAGLALAAITLGDEDIYKKEDIQETEL